MSDIVWFYFFLSFVLMNFSGYPVLLWVVRKLRPRRLNPAQETRDLDPQSALPPLHVLIPVYNEAEFIGQKLDNLASLDYPPDKLWVCIIDGGSTDATLSVIHEFLSRKNPLLNLKVLQPGKSGKVPQMNEALALVPMPGLVVVSDADTLVSPREALTRLVRTFQANPEVGVIGGWTIPSGRSAQRADIAYWDKENRLRYLESKSFATSIVLAPFYAFRRELIGLFPEDCVADDVYVSFVSHLHGQRAVYLPEIEAREYRQPSGFLDLFHHKARKAHAYSTELLRVVYRLPQMKKRLKLIYLYKIFQFFYLPWIPFALAAETLVLWFHGYQSILVWSYASFVVLLLLTSAFIAPPEGKTRGGLSLGSLIATVQIFVLINVVLIYNFLRFPFWSQTSSYARTGQRRRVPRWDAMAHLYDNT